MIRSPFIAGLLVLAALLPPAISRAAPPNLEGLVQNSPFAGSAAVAGGARPDAPLEFRGVMVEQGEKYFSIYETSSHSSLWVAVNEPGNPYKVRAYDVDKGTVSVDYKGSLMTLPLKQAKVLVQAPSAPPSPTPAAGPQPGAPVNVTSANPGGDPAKIVEEIRRRRAIRQQAAQPVPNAAAGPTPSFNPAANPSSVGPVPVSNGK